MQLGGGLDSGRWLSTVSRRPEFTDWFSSWLTEGERRARVTERAWLDKHIVVQLAAQDPTAASKVSFPLDNGEYQLAGVYYNEKTILNYTYNLGFLDRCLYRHTKITLGFFFPGTMKINMNISIILIKKER